MTRTEAIRRSLGWSQMRMAAWLGASQSAVSRLERGQAEPGPIARMLDLLEERAASPAGSPPAEGSPPGGEASASPPVAGGVA